MRVVSFVPAASRWLAEMGAIERLVGRSHDWDAPEATDVPIASREGEDGGVVLDDVLRTLAPDVVILSRLYGSCAPQFEAAHREIQTVESAAVCVFDPVTFKQTLDAVLALSRACEILPHAMSYIAGREQALGTAQHHRGVRRRRDGPILRRIVCLNAVDPPTTSGRWLPDLVEMAGGTDVLSDSGQDPRIVSWEDIASARPDEILIADVGAESSDAAVFVRAELGRQGAEAIIRPLGGTSFTEPGPSLYDVALTLVEEWVSLRS